jgi:hypothetical protein
MPLKLSTTIGKIANIPNSKNIEIINEFLKYMRSNGSSEHYQNNNQKVLKSTFYYYSYLISYNYYFYYQ